MSDKPWTQYEHDHARWVRRVRFFILIVPLFLTGLVLYRMRSPEPEDTSKLVWQRDVPAELGQDVGEVLEEPEEKKSEPWFPFFGAYEPPSRPEPPAPPPPAPEPPRPRPEPVIADIPTRPASRVSTIKSRFEIGKLEAAPPAEAGEPQDVGRARLVAGTLLPAVLLQTVNSDEPGLVQARLTQDVFDTLTGRHLAIPAGTLMIGRADGLGAARQGVAMTWRQMIFPGGRTLDLEMSTTDRDGGLPTGKRQTHTLKKVGAVLLSASTAAALQVSQRPSSTSDIRVFSPGQIGTEGAVRDVSRVIDDWAEEKLRRPPTVILPLGSEVLVQLLDDLNL